MFASFIEACKSEGVGKIYGLGSELVMSEAAWLQDAIVNGKAIDAGKHVVQVFGDQESLVSILENISSAKTTPAKAWFAIGYMCEVVRVMRKEGESQRTILWDSYVVRSANSMLVLRDLRAVLGRLVVRVPASPAWREELKEWADTAFGRLAEEDSSRAAGKEELWTRRIR